MILGIGLVAFFYALVGHAGGSGYLAIGLPKQAALVLNLGVSLMACLAFSRAAGLRWGLLLPLLAGSIPMAFLGAMISVPGALVKPLLGMALALAAWRMAWPGEMAAGQCPAATIREEPPAGILVAGGAGLGLLSGLTGIGGGVYLSPLLLLTRTATLKQTAALSSAFIFCNSLSSLFAAAAKGPLVLPHPAWFVAALLGGALGAGLGAFKASPAQFRWALAGITALVSAKLLGLSA